MKDTVLKISLAALFHDIGKFAQEALELPAGYRENNADLYQPFRDGHHTHTHALYTAAFIEKYQTYFPKELNSPDWGEGEHEDSFINLAAKHHKPGTALQLIITQADRLSSGFDRAEFQEGEEIGVREYRQTRLLPIFERLLRQDKKFDKPEDFEWRYSLTPISAQNIFPVKLKELKKEEAREEYRRLFSDFEKDLSLLCHKNHVELWAQHFDSLLRVYTSHIPAARVGKVIHDVSLYDHLRTTAALAGALYLYHRETESLNEKAICDDRPKKFLLVSGDFYGIQDFIFRGGGEERHHRAKLLRGRSFLVSLMMELAAQTLCEKVGLSFLSVFFSAAGKFHLLAPNTESARKAINEAYEQINNWLYENFFGECAIGFALTEASPSEFTGGSFVKLWQRHLDNLEEAKFNRFELAQHGGVFEDYLDSFDNTLPKPICPLCDTRPSAREVLNDDYIKRRGQEEEACACKLCRDQAFLGTELVKGKRLAVVKGDDGALKEPLFGLYQIKFLNGCAGEFADKKKLIRLYDLNVKAGKPPVGATFLPINGYVPVFKEEDQYFDCLLAGQKQEQKYEELIEDIKEERPKSFYHLAQKALRAEFEDQKIKCYGLPALGVLKADVDNLGAIFGCGLPEGLFTISRLSTMSRQLNNFFTIYLPYALEYEKNGRFQDIYTVFAGGDDLFLIGPWNRVRELALFLREKFAAYVCENPKLHFSAGITLHKPHVPVDLLAEEAEEALSRAKTEPKDQVSMFGQVVSWKAFQELFEIEQTLASWHEGFLSRGALYRLNDLLALAEEEARLLSSGSIPWHRLQCVKWPAFLRYFLVRLIERQVKNDWQVIYQQVVTQLYTWIHQYRGNLVLALWPLLYETRKQRL